MPRRSARRGTRSDLWMSRPHTTFHSEGRSGGLLSERMAPSELSRWSVGVCSFSSRPTRSGAGRLAVRGMWCALSRPLLSDVSRMADGTRWGLTRRRLLLASSGSPAFGLRRWAALLLFGLCRVRFRRARDDAAS